MSSYWAAHLTEGIRDFWCGALGEDHHWLLAAGNEGHNWIAAEPLSAAGRMSGGRCAGDQYFVHRSDASDVIEIAEASLVVGGS